MSHLAATSDLIIKGFIIRRGAGDMPRDMQAAICPGIRPPRTPRAPDMEFRDMARGGPATGGPGDSDQELWKQALTFLARGLAHKTYRARAEE